MSGIDTSSPRPKRRIFFRLFRGFLIFVVLLIVTYLIADQILLRKVQHKREAFKERFGAVDFRDFIPERPKPEEDAGRVYRYAVGLMAKADEQYGDWSMYDALTKGPEAFDTRGRGDDPLPTPEEVDGKVREKMAAMDEAFRKVEEAQSLTRGSVVEIGDVDDVPYDTGEPRNLARNIAAKAVFTARENDLDGAARWLESGLHMAATMNEDPTLIELLVRIACIDLSLKATETIMNGTDAEIPLSARYWMLLGIVADPEVHRKNMASEAAFGLTKKMPIPRLFWSTNELKLIDFWFAVDSALGLASLSERRAQLDALAQGASGPMLPTNVVVPILAPAIVGGIDGFDRMTARCDLLHLAMALRTWKHVHGAYPDSLDEIASDIHEPLRLDPFSGEAYHYRREGEGFMLYSVGPDRKDDGGVKVENLKSGGDIVWMCVR